MDKPKPNNDDRNPRDRQEDKSRLLHASPQAVRIVRQFARVVYLPDSESSKIIYPN